MERVDDDVVGVGVEMVAPLKEEEGANALVDARIARRVAKVFMFDKLVLKDGINWNL